MLVEMPSADLSGETTCWKLGYDKEDAKVNLKQLAGRAPDIHGWNDDYEPVQDAIDHHPVILLETTKFVDLEDWVEANVRK